MNATVKQTMEADELPFLCTPTMVSLSRVHYQKMLAGISAIEALQREPHQPSSGLFFSWDFHVHENDVKLIEINSNAGGVFINQNIAEWFSKTHKTTSLMWFTSRAQLVDVFLQEWAGFAERPLKNVVLVDESPTTQFLYPEFLACQAWLSKAGINVFIADPKEIAWNSITKTLEYQGMVVDMMYNRLTDFELEYPAHQHLRAGLSSTVSLITPSPMHHRQWADKLWFTRFSDKKWLMANAPEEIYDTIQNIIPDTVNINGQDATEVETLWRDRKNYFFKPRSGFGGQAVYRGDKLTRSTFQAIMARSDYLRQAIVMPSQHYFDWQGESKTLKYDIRIFRAHEKTLGVVARLYQGQTTNFRTEGGGFAPMTLAD